MSIEDEILPASTPRVPPHSVEAERAAIGCILLDPQATLPKFDSSSEDLFYDLRHKEIFKSILRVSERGGDGVTAIAEDLLQRGVLNDCGGFVYLAELTNATPSPTAIDYFLSILIEKLSSRQLITVAGEAIEAAYTKEPEDVAKAIERLSSWSIGKSLSSVKKERSKHEVMSGLIQRMEIERKGNFDQFFVRTGIHDLDRYYRGLPVAESIILAARPSCGKTALALNMATNIAEQGHAVGFISLEMTEESLYRRAAASLAGVNLWNIQELGDQQLKALTSAFAKLSKMPIHVNDQSGLSCRQIRNIARRWLQQHQIKVLFIDYLQIATGFSKRGRDDRRLEIGEISKEFKETAKELNIPVVTLCQLSRLADQNNKPKLSHLREAGEIEQDADMVMFIWSKDDEKEKPVDDIETEDPHGTKNIVLSIAKNRNGPTGDVRLKFVKSMTKFFPIAHNHTDSLKDHP